MSDLSQRLKDATPEPPDLGGLAHRSAVAGRRRRDRVRVVGAAALALVVLGVGLTLPRLLHDGGPEPVKRSDPQCVAQPDAPLEAIETVEATWVRFCEPEDGATQQARHHPGALTGEVAAFHVQGWADWLPEETCEPARNAPPGRLFRAQVGLVDGRVVEIEGDTSCARDGLFFLQLETPLVHQLNRTRRDEVVSPVQAACPATLTTTETNTDGLRADLLRVTSGNPALSTVPLLPDWSSQVDVCAYTGAGAQRTLVDSWTTPDTATLSHFAAIGYTDGQADCDPRPGATSYVVVMHDLTGTARTFSIDGAACNAMQAAIGTPAVETYLGLASDDLVRTVRQLRDQPGSSADQQ